MWNGGFTDGGRAVKAKKLKHRWVVEACVGSGTSERAETTRTKLGSRELRSLGVQRSEGWESIRVDEKRRMDQGKKVELG